MDQSLQTYRIPKILQIAEWAYSNHFWSTLKVFNPYSGWGILLIYRLGGGRHIVPLPFSPLGKCHFLSGGGPLEIFQVLWIFSDPPYCRSEIFLIPPEVLQNLSDPPPNLIIKVAELVSVFKAEIDHPLGLLKMKAENLRGTLIVVRIKLQNSHHINIFYMTDKKFSRQLLFIPSYFLCYGKQVTMATERYFYLSCLKV